MDASGVPVDDPDGYAASLDQEYWSSRPEDEMWTVADLSLQGTGSVFDPLTSPASAVSQNCRNMVL